MRNNKGEDKIYRVMYELSYDEYHKNRASAEERARRANREVPEVPKVQQVAGPYSSLSVAKGQMTANSKSKYRFQGGGTWYIEAATLDWQRI